jgi:cytochrome P450
MMWRKAVTLTETITFELEQQMPPGPTGDEKAISGTTEINAWASKVTLDIIGVAGLGQEFNVLRNSDHQLVRDYEELLEPTVEKLLFFLTSAYISPKYVKLLPWGLNEVFKRTTTSLSNMCSEFVRNKRQAMKAGSDDHFDILSLLIKSNDFSDKELSDQLLTFLAAG